jgi:hypothetical protein
VSVDLSENASCLAAGDVVDFPSWRLHASNGSVRPVGVDATLVDGEVHLHTSHSGDVAIAAGPTTGTVAFPSSDGTALEIDIDPDGEVSPPDATGFGGLSATIDTFFQTTLHPGANLICVPRGMRDTTPPLQINLEASGQDGLDARVQHAVVHLPIVRTGTCVNEDVVDGDFNDPNSWRAIAFGSDRASIDNGIATLSGCQYHTVLGTMTVPQVEPAGGPALHVTYRFHGRGRADIRVDGGGVGGLEELGPTGAAFEERTVCIRPQQAGRLCNITFLVDGGGTDACPSTGPDEPTLEVAKVRADNDASCPH